MRSFHPSANESAESLQARRSGSGCRDCATPPPNTTWHASELHVHSRSCESPVRARERALARGELATLSSLATARNVIPRRDESLRLSLPTRRHLLSVNPLPSISPFSQSLALSPSFFGPCRVLASKTTYSSLNFSTSFVKRSSVHVFVCFFLLQL